MERPSSFQEQYLPTQETATSNKKEIGTPRFEIITDPYIRVEMKKRTELLIKRVQEEQIDTLVFLDKSARPLAWLFRELWKQSVPDSPMPQIKFINVGIAGHDALRSTSPKIDKFRIYFEPPFEPPNRGETIQSYATQIQHVFGDTLADQRILMIDEMSFTGASLQNSIDVMTAAYPNSDVSGTAMFQIHELPFEQVPWRDKTGAMGIWEMGDDAIAHGASEVGIHRAMDELSEKIKDRMMKQYDVDMVAELYQGIQEDLSQHQIKLYKTIHKYLTRDPELELLLEPEDYKLMEQLRTFDISLPSRPDKAPQNTVEHIVAIVESLFALSTFIERFETLYMRTIFTDNFTPEQDQKVRQIYAVSTTYRRTFELNILDFLYTLGLEDHYNDIVKAKKLNISRIREKQKQLRKEIQMIANIPT